MASAVFADQYGCWGFLDLWRDESREPFGGADAEFIASLAAPLTSALRHCQARTFVEPSTPHRSDAGPVVLMLDDGLQITSRTAASQAWLEVLLPPEPDEQAIPASVYNVAAQLLAAENGIDDHPAYVRTHLAGGFWLTLRAARLSSGERPGAPAERGATLSSPSRRRPPPSASTCSVAPSASAAREHELLGLLAAGSDTRAMARQMSLSEHTIQDHLKSIFAKTGARDRVTVLSRALGTRREANRSSAS